MMTFLQEVKPKPYKSNNIINNNMNNHYQLRIKNIDFDENE